MYDLISSPTTQSAQNAPVICSTVKINPEGTKIAIPIDTYIQIYNISDGSLFREIQTNHIDSISDIVWSPDGKCIASGSNDCTIQIYHIEKYGLLHILQNHTGPVISLCYNNKGNLLFSGSMDESVKTWDVLNGKCLRTISAHSDPVVSINIPSMDNSVMASGSYDGLVRIFDTETGHCLSTLTYDKDWQNSGRVVPITQVLFSQNGKFLLVKSLDGAVKLWDCIRGKVVRTFITAEQQRQRQIGKYSCGMTMSYITDDNNDEPSKVIVISGDENGYITCWDSNTKQILQTIDSGSRNPVMAASCLNGTLAVITRDGLCNIYEWTGTK